MVNTITAKFYDTNALLCLLEKAFEERFICSSKTFEEIENIKTDSRKDQEIKYSARQLTRLLDKYEGEYDVVLRSKDRTLSTLNRLGLPETADNIIMADAFFYNRETQPIVFYTNDIACRIIAREVFNLSVKSATNEENEIYKGYKVIKGNTDFINQEIGNIDYSKWHVNEYLIIENVDDCSIKEMRFNGKDFVPLKLPTSKFIKAKNSLQRCALDALMNKDITVVSILGGYGSGKTFLAMQMALYSVQEKGCQSKILGIREPHGEGREVGFLPGSLEEKTDNFFLPLAQQLNSGEFELESLKQRGVLESTIPYYLKGTTYHDTVVVCDEAEDLTESQLRLVGTRLGRNSKIFFSGDYKQSLLNKTSDNALVKMCNKLKGSPKFACIYLDEDVRSETSKLFAELFT